MSVESILQYAFDRFDACNYDEAVKAFMAAYVASDDGGQKADIFEVINENFIRPNLNEFKNAFDENIKKLINNGILSENNAPEYGDNSLLMIPVSNTVYYVWDKENMKFYSGQHYDFSVNPSGDVYRSIDSLIIDGFSDLKMILNATSEELYSHEYIVMENEKIRNEFFSFFMIPGIADWLDEATKIFYSKSELLEFLYETGNYIPRTIKCASGYDYAGVMSELHQKRISEPKRNKPLLAITMPTLNRGKKALENVKRLQSLMYDEEVEFIICNNSSTKELEFYDQIGTLAQSDSRIKYYVKPSEDFQYSVENVLSIPDTKYALYCSDEDFIIHQNFGYVLETINKNPNFGVICFGVLGENYYLEKDEIKKDPGSLGLQAGFGCSYITGLCIKPKEIKEYDLIKRFSKYRKNIFYIYYAHCVYTAYLAHKNGFYQPNIPVFFDSTESILDDKEGSENAEAPAHIHLEHRLTQFESQAEILADMDVTKDELMNCVYSMFMTLYLRLRVGYGYYYQAMEKLHSWDEACQIINDCFKKLINCWYKEGILDQDAFIKISLYYEEHVGEEMTNRPVDYRELNNANSKEKDV